ncbi:HVO_0476 family zinc finger protein [Methanothermobacter sp.]|uniref:HVO_0476 family zinc finger protein n=1 Tax=Methanothermobacter sp. TaxID=1884223 RepID=UPI002603FC48|nr:HVO_0476 family zinc finger protein [Methanothermobacter sp.]MDI9618229.1 HVO_0476 family zinc finger protein [Methanothermobacter sp.]
MQCPICGSKAFRVLKSRTDESRSRKVKHLVLECEECGTVFKDSLVIEKPKSHRIIISEHGSSYRDEVDLYPYEEVSTGDAITVSGKLVEITSLELKSGKRVDKATAADVETLWAVSLEAPVRVGISVDLHGEVYSRKVEVDRDFEFRVGDVMKIDEHVFKIRSIKTEDGMIRRGSVPAQRIKRVYGYPVNLRFRQDLTDMIV